MDGIRVCCQKSFEKIDMLALFELTKKAPNFKEVRVSSMWLVWIERTYDHSTYVAIVVSIEFQRLGTS